MGVLAIPFPSHIYTNGFEDMLKEYYAPSRKKQVKEIIFDFSKVQWCETFELSLTALWILYLREEQKEVTFIFPQLSPFPYEEYLSDKDREGNIEWRRKVSSYLTSCRFAKFLEQYSVKSINPPQHIYDPKPIQHPISPFIFFSITKDFEEFMKTLYHRTQIVFEEVLKDLESGQPEEIRDIILREIGQNMFDHAQGRFAHLVMVKRTESAKSFPKLEERFFRAPGNFGYLEIIISDKGPGIFQTLKDAYDKDKVIPDKKENPEEYDILRYAFLQHSTRKSREERLKAYLNVLKNPELEDVTPATGLYWAKEVVKEYRGFLSVRSGSSIICYDFLNDPEGILSTNAIDKRYEKLANFGGTQIKIYFPFRGVISKEKLRGYMPYPYPEKVSSQYVYKLISLKSVIEGTMGEEDIEKEGNGLLSLVEEFHKIKLSPSSTNKKVIIIDFEDVKLSNKALYILTIEIMRIQNQNTLIIGINVEDKLELLKDIPALTSKEVIKDNGIQKERSFVVFNKNLEAFLIGVSKRDIEVFDYLINPLTFKYLHKEGVSPTKEEIKKFIDKNVHLFEFDPDTERYRFVISMSILKEKIRDNIKKGLSEIIKDPLNEIFYENGHFLIPSGAYSEGYFQVKKLVDNPSWEEKIIKWLSYWIEDLEPQSLITLGKSWGLVGNKIVSNQIKSVEHINIQNPRESHELYKLALMDRGKKVIIFTDVIGTKRTIHSILEQCKDKHLDVLKVLTVVDARQDGEPNDFIKYNGNKYKLESILRRPISFWYEGLPEHWKYEEIVRIDPISGTPITEPLKIEAPLWMKIDKDRNINEFLERVIRSSNSLVIGHFESTKKHIIYLFLTPLIAEKYKEEIAEEIRSDIDYFKERSHADPQKRTLKITHILYPEHTPGAKEIAERICSSFMGSNLLPLTQEKIQHALLTEKLKELQDVIIFDDASTTGDTVKRMIEIAERAGAKWVLAYILFNRADPFNARLLQKIKRYGEANVEVRYLADAGIPTYDSESCPICKTIKTLERIKGEIKEIDELKTLLEEEIVRLEKKPISMILSPEGCSPYLSTPIEERITQGELRWKLEMAKENPFFRKDLAEIVRDWEKDAKKVLSFFEVLSLEKQYFLENREVFDEIFYPTFKNGKKGKKGVIDVALHFIKELHGLSEREIESTLSVLRMFDEKRFIDELNMILKKASYEPKMLYRIILHIFLSDEAKQHPTRIARILQEFRKSHPEDDKISGVLNKSIQYWENKSKDVMPSGRKNIIKAYKELILRDLRDSGLLGNLIGFICALEEYKRKSIDAQKIKEISEKYWLTINNAITDDILPKLNLLKVSGISSEVEQKLERSIPEINSLVTRADELVDLIMKDNIERGRFDMVVEGLTTISTRLKFLLIEDRVDTIFHSLNLLKTELKDITERILSRYEPEFGRIGITLYKDKIEDACLVFGHDSDIFVIINNLIDNIVKRAFEGVELDEKKVKIIIRKDEDTGEAYLHVLDNGKGIEGIKFGTGLNEVELRVEKVGGDFGPVSSPTDRDYNTEMKVRLNYIPYR